MSCQPLLISTNTATYFENLYNRPQHENFHALIITSYNPKNRVFGLKDSNEKKITYKHAVKLLPYLNDFYYFKKKGEQLKNCSQNKNLYHPNI